MDQRHDPAIFIVCDCDRLELSADPESPLTCVNCTHHLTAHDRRGRCHAMEET